MGNGDGSGDVDGVCGASRRQRARKVERDGRLRLTAMIDVVFLLLVYFVVTTSFAEREGVVIARLPGPPPEVVVPEPPEREALRVTVSSAGAYGYRLAIADAGLGARDFVELQGVLAQLQYAPGRGRHGMYRPERDRVEIQPDGQVRWAHVVNAYNAAVAAEYQKVGLRFAE